MTNCSIQCLSRTSVDVRGTHTGYGYYRNPTAFIGGGKEFWTKVIIKKEKLEKQVTFRFPLTVGSHLRTMVVKFYRSGV